LRGPALSDAALPLRAGTDADDYGALIGACWREYPGVVFDLDAELPELRAFSSYVTGLGGAVWVAGEDRAALDGMIAVTPERDGAWQIRRMYMPAHRRGSGLAARLLATAEAHAWAAGATRLELFSDTRFVRAHRFYEKNSYLRTGPLRVLDDLSNSIEFGYSKPRWGTVVLDAAAAQSAVPRLAAILRACVDGGAPLGLFPPLDPAAAIGPCRRVADGVARGDRTIVVGFADGVLAGAVSLDRAVPPTQAHRATLRMLMVDPAQRGQGVARALIETAEREAVRAGRFLLTVEAPAEGAAAHLFRALGYVETGRIPDAARDADGLAFHDAALFHKILGETA
jgi:GNAT superfamily N-acetyltransferase